MMVFDNGEPMLDHPQLASLVAEGAIKGFTFTAKSGGFMLTVTSKTSVRHLHTQRKKPRIFRNLETGLAYLRAMGVVSCSVDFVNFTPSQKSML
jgi:hypothetical protein